MHAGELRGRRRHRRRCRRPAPPHLVTPLPMPSAGEDLWHAYNLVLEGDRVEATTFRKVQKDGGTGAESERVKLKLMVRVEGVEYDAEGEWWLL